MAPEKLVPAVLLTVMAGLPPPRLTGPLNARLLLPPIVNEAFTFSPFAAVTAVVAKSVVPLAPIVSGPLPRAALLPSASPPADKIVPPL